MERRTTRGAATRRPHTKSRTGCQTCKRRHVRCDENQPKCLNCVKQNASCTYQLRESGPRTMTRSSPIAPAYPTPGLITTNSSPSTHRSREDPAPNAVVSTLSVQAVEDALRASKGSTASLDPYPNSPLSMTPERRDQLTFCKWILGNSRKSSRLNLYPARDLARYMFLYYVTHNRNSLVLILTLLVQILRKLYSRSSLYRLWNRHGTSLLYLKPLLNLLYFMRFWASPQELLRQYEIKTPWAFSPNPSDRTKLLLFAWSIVNS